MFSGPYVKFQDFFCVLEISGPISIWIEIWVFYALKNGNIKIIQQHRNPVNHPVAYS